MFGQRRFEVLIDDSGLDPTGLVDRVDLEDLVHPGDIEQQAAIDCVGGTRKPGPCTLSDHRNAMLGGEDHHCRDIVDRSRPHQGQCLPGGAEQGPVDGIAVDDVAVHDEGTGAQPSLQLLCRNLGRDAHAVLDSAKDLATSRTLSSASSAPMLIRTPPLRRRMATACSAHAASNACASSAPRLTHT